MVLRLLHTGARIIYTFYTRFYPAPPRFTAKEYFEYIQYVTLWQRVYVAGQQKLEYTLNEPVGDFSYIEQRYAVTTDFAELSVNGTFSDIYESESLLTIVFAPYSQTSE